MTAGLRPEGLMSHSQRASAVRTRELAWYFLRLGATGFGGPVALVGYMQRDLVERRAWFTAAEFSEGLALAQVAPGPLAAQLAMYLGWLSGGSAGATLCAVAFVAAPLVLVLIISALYVRAGALWWIGPAFVGVGAAVMCIIGRSIVKLSRLVLGRRQLLWAVALANAAGVVAWRRESVLLLLMSGVVVLVARRGFSSATALSVVPVLGIGALSLPGAPESLLSLFTFFARAGAVVFGSGLAIIPFLYAGAVEQHHWLTDRQFVDAIAVAMITPGPVVIVATFVGYLVGGVSGGVVAALGVFLPPYLIVLVAAPRFREYAGKAPVRAVVDGITAGATGALIGAAFLLGFRTLAGFRELVIAGIVLILLTIRAKIPEPLLIIGAGLGSIALV